MSTEVKDFRLDYADSIRVNKAFNKYKRELIRSSGLRKRLRCTLTRSLSAWSVSLLWCDIKLTYAVPCRPMQTVAKTLPRTADEHQATGHRFNVAVNKRFNNGKRSAMRRSNRVTRSKQILKHRADGYRLACDVYQFSYCVLLIAGLNV